MSKITMDAPSKAELDKRITELESAVKQLQSFMRDVSEMDGMPKGQAGPRGYVEEEMGNPVMVNNWFAGDKIKHEIRALQHFGKDENGNAKIRIHFFDDTSVVVKIDEVNNEADQHQKAESVNK